MKADDKAKKTAGKSRNFNEGVKKSGGKIKDRDGEERKAAGKSKSYGEGKPYAAGAKKTEGKSKSYGEGKSYAAGAKKTEGKSKSYGEGKPYAAGAKKTEGKGKNSGQGKPFAADTKKYAGKPVAQAKGKKKADEKPEAKYRKPVNEWKSFLYLLPKKTSAKKMAEVLKFIPRQEIEIWEDEDVLEITVSTGAITFEDIKETLEKDDKALLNDLRMKQVYACDYESMNAEFVQKIMEALLKEFGGIIASDTEDFRPFMELEEI